MQYKVFIDKIKELVAGHYPDCEDIIVTKVRKNNSVELDGLIVKQKGVNITPAIYLDDYYRQYLDGRDIEDIAEEIAALNRGQLMQLEFNADSLNDWGFVREKVVYGLINTAENGLLLESVPHREFMDLSVVYFVCVTAQNGDTVATVQINNSHIGRWEIGENELYELARSNTERLFPTVITRMSELMREKFYGGADDIEEDSGMDDFMYVATNKDRVYGAASLLDSRALKDFACENGDFYIIPSSVHEIILVPTESGVDKDRIVETVKEINDVQVCRDEVLSDSLYLYDSGECSILKINNINF